MYYLQVNNFVNLFKYLSFVILDWLLLTWLLKKSSNLKHNCIILCLFIYSMKCANTFEQYNYFKSATTSSSSSSSSSTPVPSPSTSTIVTINNATVTNKHNGFWFNKGQSYGKCQLLNLELNDYCGTQTKTTATTMQKLANEKFDIMKPNYDILMKNIMCTLKKINCPSNDSVSFQIHDIPCQSTCFNLLSVCAHLQQNKQFGMINRPIYCPTDIKYLFPRTQKRWLWDSRLYNKKTNNNDNNNYYPLKTNQNQAVYPYHYNNYATTRRYARYPDHMAYISPKYTNKYQSSNYLPNTFHNYLPSTWNVRKRIRRQLFDNDLDDYLFDSPVQHLRQVPITFDHQMQKHPIMGNYDQTTKLHFSPNNNNKQNIIDTNRFVLTAQDCMFLPPGGCDTWSDQLTDPHQFKNPDYRTNTKLNSGCTENLLEMCNSMFPSTFSRQQWIKGNFTVAAIIRISGTLWWFGKNGRFQPLYRFHVLKTFDSDIHPYDEKMILTYSWPLECICPGEIVLGKRYLMLTHSFKSRQTLHISKSTVFLSRVKRYTRRLVCWKGACTHRSGNSRRRRRFHPQFNQLHQSNQF